MHKAVEEKADSGDIKGLKYIFADCLDIDPTFEKYKEDYDYCQKKVPELFEKHKEITPLTENQKKWNNDYWIELKIDLVNNFSKERFEHMKKVAKVIYAKEIKVINERKETEERNLKNNNIIYQDNDGIHNKVTSVNKPFKTREEQERELAEKREKLARHNAAVEKQQRQQMENNRKMVADGNNRRENNNSKKLIGILLGIVLVILLIILIS